MNILFFLALRTCCKWRLFWFCHNVFPWQSNLHEDTIFWWHKGMELSQCLLKVLLKWFTKVGEILNFFQQLSAASSFILHAYWLFGAFPSNLCFFFQIFICYRTLCNWCKFTAIFLYPFSFSFGAESCIMVQSVEEHPLKDKGGTTFRSIWKLRGLNCRKETLLPIPFLENACR